MTCYCRFALIMFFVAALLTTMASADSAAPASRPNIVLVMADDLGWSDIGCHGGEIRTPHIDSLARDGVRFRQFYNNSICGPTRASLLTGLYCQQVGHPGTRWNEPKDFSKCVTISELLQAAGYRTMMVGKWQGRDLAVDRGFDRFFGPMCRAKISYFHEVDKNPYVVDREPWELPKDFYLTDAINDFANQFLRRLSSARNPSSSTWHTSRRIGRYTPAKPTSRPIAGSTGNTAGTSGGRGVSRSNTSWASSPIVGHCLRGRQAFATGRRTRTRIGRPSAWRSTPRR